MKLIETKLPGVILLEPRVFTDNRGFFYENYNAKTFKESGIEAVFIQDNHSRSAYGTVRGLHYQKGSASQAKLVRCTLGSVYDVAVDLRQGSKTFGQWCGYVLSAENKFQLYIPRGFAHGFSVLSETAEFQYKCDNLYAPAEDRGIRWDDPSLGIDWQVKEPIISPKDAKLPFFKDVNAQELF